MRVIAAALLGLFASETAFAGGFGVLGTAGGATAPIYFYDGTTGEQYKQTQFLPTYGAGIEFILGDRDDRINGVFRGFWLQDAPQKDPATLQDEIPAGDVIANVRDVPRDVGAATFGMSWGLVGDPERVQMVLLTSAGSAFLTDNHGEFLIATTGPGVTVRFARDLQAYADVHYTVRYRKGWSHGTTAYAGVRYLFD